MGEREEVSVEGRGGSGVKEVQDKDVWKERMESNRENRRERGKESGREGPATVTCCRAR